ncbi:MAG: polysaccharide deacetylase [Verrucomicrobiales bacterium]|nr:polysaccharide deacetylase [Verrucomicrobiales bacterium]
MLKNPRNPSAFPWLRLAGLLLAALALNACDRIKPAAPPVSAEAPVPEIVADPTPVPAPVEPVIDPAVPALTINKSAQVIVLGYHDFTTGKSRNPMEINVDHFRDQMQSLKDARLPVITMADFLAWRRGEKDIPDPSVVITMDDGWKSVHRLAFPVLKEFGYPFTIFLYKRFVNGGGRALTTPEIREMMANGAEVGSHSVSHPLPSKIRGLQKKSPDEADAFLRMEMKDSRQFLEDLIALPVRTYAYPGGYNTEREQEIGKEAGYEALFTVNPARVTWDMPASTLSRYIILGNDPNNANFRRAVSSRGTSGGDLAKALLGGTEGEALVSTTPRPDATIAERRPVIEVDVSKLQGIDPASVVMKLAGYGTVPAVYDAAAGRISYQMREALRSPECQVYVTFKRAGEPKPDAVNWRFAVDLVAHYLPEPAPVMEQATVPEGAMTLPAESPGPGAPTPQ